MNEARQVMELSAPYTAYVLPAVIIFSIVSIAEYFFSFVAGIVDKARKGRRWI